jgi:ribose-phosphate pyrophosphokinase
MKKHITLLSGSSNPELAEKVSEYLKIPLTPVEIKRFNDGETYIRIGQSVRGSHVFIFHSTSPPVNDTLMELLIIIDALKRASAKEITAVIPYFGYARQDRKATSREPITAKLVASLIERAGADRVVTFDLHVDQIQGFFDIPVDNLSAIPILTGFILARKLKDITIVSPDVGGATRARRMAKLLNVHIAIIDKRRPRHGESQILNVIGEVDGKTCILLDDLIDTAGTISNAATEIKKRGAKEVYVCSTHAVFSKDAITKLSNPDIDEIFVTDTIRIPKEKRLPNLHIVSLAPFLSEIITSVFEGQPMGIIVEEKYSELKND